jgi:hypothetical protein
MHNNTDQSVLSYDLRNKKQTQGEKTHDESYRL